MQENGVYSVATGTNNGFALIPCVGLRLVKITHESALHRPGRWVGRSAAGLNTLYHLCAVSASNDVE